MCASGKANTERASGGLATEPTKADTRSNLAGVLRGAGGTRTRDDQIMSRASISSDAPNECHQSHFLPHVFLLLLST